MKDISLKILNHRFLFWEKSASLQFVHFVSETIRCPGSKLTRSMFCSQTPYRVFGTQQTMTLTTDVINPRTTTWVVECCAMANRRSSPGSVFPPTRPKVVENFSVLLPYLEDFLDGFSRWLHGYSRCILRTHTPTMDSRVSLTEAIISIGQQNTRVQVGEKFSLSRKPLNKVNKNNPKVASFLSDAAEWCVAVRKLLKGVLFSRGVVWRKGG